MNLNLIMRQYDANPGGGGGLPPSLTDISDPNYVAPNPDVKQAEADKAAAEKAAADKAAEEAAKVTEGVNPDGTIMDGYTKNEDGTITKDTPADETPEEPTDEQFWQNVNKLHGTELKVEYPEGVDAFSPEGIYHRDKAVAANAVDQFETYLKNKLPRAYAYMLHSQAGGDDESFYSNKSYSLPEYEAFKENQDLQVKLYRSSLLTKGLDADLAQIAVDKAIKDGVIFEKADTAYKAEEKAHQDQLKQIEDAQAKAEQQYTASVNALNQTLATAVNEGKGMRFIIPDTDKNNFQQFVKQHVEYDKNGFVLVQRIDKELTAQQLESLYFLYKKGDLTGLIKAKAQTATVNRFKAAVAKTKESAASGADTKQTSGFVALGSL